MRTYRKTRVEKLMAGNPQFELFVKSEMRLGRSMEDLSAACKERFGIKLPRQTLQSYYSRVFKPETDAEMREYRRARAEARSWLEEIRAGGDVDAAKIAEVALARQIVAQSGKLADADIMALLAEQRKRMQLVQRQEALELERDKWKAQAESERRLRVQDRGRLEKVANDERASAEEVRKRIREIYGLIDAAPAAGGAVAAVPEGVDHR